MKVEKNRSSFGKIDDSTARVSIDPELASGYRDEVVVYAEQLKAQHAADGKEYTDSFFLEFARREMGIRYLNQHSITTSGLNDVPDPRFSGYSYAEIINMANNGYVVPQEVLAWAKAQQEADVIDYIVVSGEAENENQVSKDDNTNNSELNKLRALAKAQIVKSSETQKNLDKNSLELEAITEKAAYVAKMQENVIQSGSLDKMGDLIKEWKTLDEKQKAGKLSESEKETYKSLSKKISASSKTFKEVEDNAKELDEFLSSIDSIRTKTSEAKSVAQSTIDASFNLSKLDNPISEVNKQHTYQTVRASDPGLLGDVLAGVSDDTISYVAEHIGMDLQNTGNAVLEDISGGVKKDISDFAKEYSAKARIITGFAKNNVEESPVVNDSSEDDENTTTTKTGTTDETAAEQPSVQPTVAPVVAQEPSTEPTVPPEEELKAVEEPTAEPTVAPEPEAAIVEEPTAEPTVAPEPEAAIVEEPSAEPTVAPEQETVVVEELSAEPTVTPEQETAVVEEPTSEPTVAPEQETAVVEEPSAEPTVDPEQEAVVVEEPSAEPTVAPEQETAAAEEPTEAPTAEFEESSDLIKQSSARARTRSASAIPETEYNITETSEPSVKQTAEPEVQKGTVSDKENVIKTDVTSAVVSHSKNTSNYQAPNAAISVKSAASKATSDKTKESGSSSDAKAVDETETDTKTNNAKSANSQSKYSPKDNGIEAAYGTNTNFEAMALAGLAISGTAAYALMSVGQFYPMAATAIGITGASVADLFGKKSAVDKGADIAEDFASASKKTADRMKSEASKALSSHDKNMAKVESLGQQYEVLKNDNINIAHAIVQDRAKRAEQTNQQLDLDESSINVYSSQMEEITNTIGGIANEDTKIIQKINKPMNDVQIAMKDGTTAANDLSKVNDKLSERSSNNRGTGTVTISFGGLGVGISALVIAEGVALLPFPFTHALGQLLIRNGLIGLAASLLVIGAGVAATISSGKVDDNVEDNKDKVGDDYKSITKDNKAFLDVRKTMAKAQLEVPKMKLKSEELSESEQGSNNTGNTANPNNSLFENNEVTDENTRSAASSVIVNNSVETTDKADRKLSRFNDDGAVLSNRKNRRVNAASASSYSGSKK